MAHVISCPACGRALQVPEDYLGQAVQCPDCQHTFVAEGTSTSVQPGAPAPSAAVQADAPTEPHAPRRDRWGEEDEPPPDLRVRGGGRRDNAHLALTFGILGISLSSIGLCCCVFVTFAGLVCSLAAWVMGHSALKAMREGRVDSRNRGPAQTGYILGMVGTGLGVLFVILNCAFAGLNFMVDDELRRLIGLE